MSDYIYIIGIYYIIISVLFVLILSLREKKDSKIKKNKLAATKRVKSAAAAATERVKSAAKIKDEEPKKAEQKDEEPKKENVDAKDKKKVVSLIRPCFQKFKVLSEKISTFAGMFDYIMKNFKINYDDKFDLEHLKIIDYILHNPYFNFDKLVININQILDSILADKIDKDIKEITEKIKYSLEKSIEIGREIEAYALRKKNKTRYFYETDIGFTVGIASDVIFKYNFPKIKDIIKMKEKILENPEYSINEKNIIFDLYQLSFTKNYKQKFDKIIDEKDTWYHTTDTTHITIILGIIKDMCGKTIQYYKKNNDNKIIIECIELIRSLKYYIRLINNRENFDEDLIDEISKFYATIKIMEDLKNKKELESKKYKNSVDDAKLFYKQILKYNVDNIYKPNIKLTQSMLDAFKNMSESNKEDAIKNFERAIVEITENLNEPQHFQLLSGGCIKNKIYYKNLLKLLRK